jgi:hypothetical protein
MFKIVGSGFPGRKVCGQYKELIKAEGASYSADESMWSYGFGRWDQLFAAFRQQ